MTFSSGLILTCTDTNNIQPLQTYIYFVKACTVIGCATSPEVTDIPLSFFYSSLYCTSFNTQVVI